MREERNHKMSTPLTIQNKTQLLLKEAEGELASKLKEMGKELNDDHTLVLDILALDLKICRPLVLACELINRPIEQQLRSVASKLALCFPDSILGGQEKVSFSIPAYIVKEFKQALKELPK